MRTPRRREDWRSDVLGALICAAGVLFWALLLYLVVPWRP